MLLAEVPENPLLYDFEAKLVSFSSNEVEIKIDFNHSEIISR